jgi:hypothetical protein
MVERCPILQESALTRRHHTFIATLIAAAAFAATPVAFAGAPSVAARPADAMSSQMTTAQIMIKADENHDGRISAGEAAQVTDLASRFPAVDADHDGFLSASELYAAKHAPKTP